MRRRLAFFASMLPSILLASSIPAIGPGLGLWFCCVVWAVAGFRYFIGAVIGSIVLDSQALIQAQGIAAAGGPVVQKVATYAVANDPSGGIFILVSEMALYAGFAILLYYTKKDIQRKLRLRLGDRVI